MLSESLLDSVSLELEVAGSALVKGEVIVVLALLDAAKAARNIRLTSVAGVVSVSDSRDGSDSDVLVEELGSGKLCEWLLVVNVLLLLTLLDAVQLTRYNGLHGFENGNKIDRLLLENGVVGEGAELLVATLGPVGYLVVDDVDFLESLLDLLVVSVDEGQVLVHLNNLSVVHGGVLILIVVTLVNLQLLEALGKLLVIFLESVDLSLRGGHSL